MVDTIPVSRAMLAGNPEANPSKGQWDTPRCAKFGDQTQSGGSKTNSPSCELTGSRTLACVQSTRLVMVGQRTDWAIAAQVRVGVRS